MYTKDSAYSKVSELVIRFDEQYASYKKSDYNETLTRRDFIDPFFRTLGWDIDNQQGFAEAYREVIHEDRVKVSGATKAPDYSFRLSGGKRLFFVEAKKPSVQVKDEIHPSYQVRRYGWSAKLPVSIITDFEEFSVYDCTKKPHPNDRASVARINYLTYKDYLNEFDFLWSTFSKEHVLKGSFDKFIQSDKNKKGTTTVDKEFLQSLDGWRTLLALSISKNNRNLDEDELNFVVQSTIDRIIFLRIAEDRGIETYAELKNALTGEDYYRNLLTSFRQADDKYNSGLFDFRKDRISNGITVENKVIKKIINELYYPESPYEFAVLPVEILGSAYEQFLGKVIRIDKSHKAKIEEKPEVRKAGGVYYTPQYIVDYIVKNTVGKLVENKTPNEVSKLKIVDPACGSGSFLLGAYQFLLDWHKEIYSKETIHSSRRGTKGDVLTAEGSLTTSEKKRILLNNVFGVDIDANAVEVTKLSLLLKCLEGETSASIEHQLSMFNERVLPTLDDNIKVGNSLIDTDFYSNQLDFGEEKKIKPFNWQKAFPGVFAQGGFDAVIGNPPYGAELTTDVKEYLNKQFQIGTSDTAAIFMIQSQAISKHFARIGLIIPKPFTYASNWKKVRDSVINDLQIIVDCSKVWKEVKLEMTIYISEKGCHSEDYISCLRNGEVIEFLGIIQKSVSENFGFILNGVSDLEISVATKMISHKKYLSDYMNNQRGGMLQQFVSAKGDFMVLGGKQISRYATFSSVEKGYIDSDRVSDEKARICDNSILAQNIVAHIQNPFPHIRIIATLSSVFEKHKFVILDTVNQLTNFSEIDIRILLAILCSKLINWYTYKFIFANAIRTMHFDSTCTSRIPFPDLESILEKKSVSSTELITLVEQLYSLSKEKQSTSLISSISQIESKIDYCEDRINKIVYELYGLTEEEIRIVENL
ncbi:MAG: N-6 DNA methylase [Ignavibacteria bacterium]|nr:N-6 DNA methylase [Ignavibacteria bacterium]